MAAAKDNYPAENKVQISQPPKRGQVGEARHSTKQELN